MIVSLRWLLELCPAGLPEDEIARRLTLAGLEVEGRTTRAIGPGVVAARVVSREPVPGSDHLSLCRVDDGAGTHPVVCGAQNYGAGDVVPMARVGAVLPGGLEIRKVKLRGVESHGMLCSARELGLSDDHGGLMILPRETKVGAAMDEVLGLPDTLLELNVTPNRPDALSHLGVARELSALSGVAVHVPASAPGESGEAVEAAAQVDVQDAQRCPRYAARVIEGVRVGPSPLWVQERLRSCGVRPVSNVVDATNLALLELGHPLHAFDLDRLAGARIAVRRARDGEPITTLDGKERTLTADDLVIADAEKPVALAGIMGGQTSEVGDGTTRILLESAMFEPSGVRRTAKRQALHTEASHRFERGMDEQGARLALDRCTSLIVQLAGGRVRRGVIDRFPAPVPATLVRVRPQRIAAVLGVDVPVREVESRLASLGLAPVGGDEAQREWRVPSWRRDLTREIDCVEEVARLRGYDTIPIALHKAALGETAAISKEQRLTRAARAALSAAGCTEVLNYSFVAERDLGALWPAGGAPKPLRVANPLTVEQGAMRTSLLAGLLRNAAYNRARGLATVRLYELGRVYLPERDPRHPEGPLAWPAHEPRRLALLLCGERSAKGWTGGGERMDFYDAKGAVEGVLRALGLAGEWSPAQAPALHPASAASLRVGGAAAGVVGQLHPLVARHFDVPAETFAAELEWDALLAHAQTLGKLHGVPRFPAVSRDLAFVVDAAVPADRLVAEIRAADGAGLLEAVSVFDVYRGAPVPEGRKSMAFGLSLRAADRTLTDAEADALCSAIRERLQRCFGAEIRA